MGVHGLCFGHHSAGNVPGITAWFRLDLGMNQFKAGNYVVGIGI